MQSSAIPNYPRRYFPSSGSMGFSDGNLHSIVLSVKYVLILEEKFTGNGSNKSQQGDFHDGG